MLERVLRIKSENRTSIGGLLFTFSFVVFLCFNLRWCQWTVLWILVLTILGWFYQEMQVSVPSLWEGSWTRWATPIPGIFHLYRPRKTPWRGASMPYSSHPTGKGDHSKAERGGGPQAAPSDRDTLGHFKESDTSLTWGGVAFGKVLSWLGRRTPMGWGRRLHTLWWGSFRA